MIIHYSNNFKSGLKVLFDKKPCCIESVEFVKPGKGQVFYRVKLRKLITNQLIEKTFRSTDFLYSANIIDTKLTYIYHDDNFWYFMNDKNFDQLSLDKTIVKNKSKWLIEQNQYTITLWNEQPISISIKNFVTLQVKRIISQNKSDYMTNTKNFQLCQLNTGAIIKVPLFIQVKDMIKIDTRTGEYNSRIKK
ncbi:elongation factor P [Buchnera aphidicola]|uniref:Elongation factor P n=1 Tax=Buchnera aphidicola (Stegophylla sp.) TaxID=2315800 RepID=A0A4D6YAT6_9GAMM|nr:elongation factor P [Buchnera aphidicola (Stegophylla sp.)]QCI26222.1 elongation factor P [Buchnera aphidicola (Stegophylla sp.)]